MFRKEAGEVDLNSLVIVKNVYHGVDGGVGVAGGWCGESGGNTG